MSMQHPQAELEVAAKAMQEGQLEQAQSLYRKIVERSPVCAEAWFGLGAINARIGNSHDAILMLERAMAISGPRPEYHNNLGGAKASLGRFAEADAHYREAIRLRPEFADPYYNLAMIHRFKAEDGYHDRIEKVLETNKWSNDELVHLHFAAGKIYDDLKEFDRAFEHFRRANGFRRTEFDRGELEQLLERSLKIFNSTDMAEIAKRGHQDRHFVFVVGMPRSGTTLVEQILSTHSRVHGAGELPHVSLVARDLTKHSASKAVYPDSIRDVPGDAFCGFGRWYAGAVGSLDADAQVYIDKNPNNFRYLGLINAMLPRAKIIHCRRDPLDTCLSCFFMNFHKEGDYSFDVENLAEYYSAYRRFMDHWRSVLTIPILDVDYESLVAEPEKHVRRMIEFIGMEWEPGVMDYDRTNRAVQTASKWQVRQPIYNSSVRRWKNYECHLQPMFEALRERGIHCGEQ